MNNDFNRAIDLAMKDLDISKQEAIAHLTMYMCGHGTTEDFKDYINYLIKTQRVD